MRACTPILPGAPTQLVFGRLLHGRDVVKTPLKNLTHLGDVTTDVQP